MLNLSSAVAVFERLQQRQIRLRSLQIGSPRHIWTWGPQAVPGISSLRFTVRGGYESTLIFVAPFTIFSMITKYVLDSRQAEERTNPR
jgi:hypothetical protein